MHTVLLVAHLMIAAALVGVVLLQKSEGGALGIGGGGGGFLTGRGQANFLTRLTAGLAVLFFMSSIGLSLIGRQTAAPTGSVFDKSSTSAPATPGTTAPAATEGQPATPAAPSDAAPAGEAAPGGATPGAPAQPRGGILDKLQ